MGNFCYQPRITSMELFTEMFTIPLDREPENWVSGLIWSNILPNFKKKKL